MDKIEKIRNDLSAKNSDNEPNYEKTTTLRMDSFQTTTNDDVRRIISNLSSASCALDQIKTALAKQCLDILLTIYTKIDNISLESGVFPLDLEAAIIRPSLKKTSFG